MSSTGTSKVKGISDLKHTNSKIAYSIDILKLYDKLNNQEKTSFAGLEPLHF